VKPGLKIFFAALALIAGSACAHAQAIPAPVKALEAQGLVVKGPMSAPAGFKGFVGEHQGRSLPLYLLPDGRHVLVGTLFDAHGHDLTSTAFAQANRPAMDDALWRKLDHATWVAEGPATAKRVVYVFTDTECPYCNRLWQAIQPHVAHGDVQVRYIIVAVIAPQSLARGAAVLDAKSPANALRIHEQSFGHSRLAPESAAPAATQRKILANSQLMEDLGVQGTPAVVYKDAQGTIHMLQGMVPADRMNEVFGP